MDSIQLGLPFLPEAQWKDIPGYENKYQVSDTGLVRAVQPSAGRPANHVLAVRVSKITRYVSAALWRNSLSKTLYVHRLVMLAFVGVCPDGYQVNHKNGIRGDNRRENLEYVTRKENARHAIEVLNHRNRGAPVLDEQKVVEIRRLFATGSFTQRELGEMFNVPRPTIASVTQRRNWKHI